MLFLLSPVIAATEAAADPNLNQVVDAIGEAIASGKMVVAVAGIVMILVWAFRKYALPRLGLGSGSLPYLAVLLSAVIGICSAILGGMSVGQAANVVLISGPSAMALWSGIFSLISKKE